MEEKANPVDTAGATIVRGGSMQEKAGATGFFTATCYDKDGNIKWIDNFHNTVITEGKNAMLTNALKGSSYSATLRMGIIESTGYSAISASNTAANITAVGGGSPTNGWNEATSSMCSTRGTPTLGSASSGSISTSSAVAFSIGATATIKGAFLLVTSSGGTAPTSTVGNTNGAIWSAGLFSGGDRSVLSGDTINVSYTTSL